MKKITKKEGYFKMNKKSLLMMMVTICLIAVVGVGATLAYLTDSTDVLKNTFTFGKVDINLDEPSFEEDKTVDGIVPGQVIPKDPTVTVEAGSVESYVFMKVSGIDEMEALGDTEEDKDKGFVVEIDTDNWTLLETEENGVKDGIYVYNKTVSTVDKEKEVLAPLFSEVVYSVNNTEYVGDTYTIDVQAAAIQAKNGDATFTQEEALALVDWK